MIVNYITLFIEKMSVPDNRSLYDLYHLQFSFSLFRFLLINLFSCKFLRLSVNLLHSLFYYHPG
jgi:hypothetical protein